MRIRCRIAIPVLALVLIAGCSSTRETRVGDATSDPDADIRSKKGQSIDGYVTIDGAFHKVKSGRVRFHPPDTLEFWSRTRSEYGDKWEDTGRFFMPQDSVQSILFRHGSAGKTIGTVVGVTVIVAGVAAVILAASSCPFLYSYDGEQYVLDAEPYGGATMRALERTDWSEMEHLVPTDGSYRVRVTNEMDETQHTNRLSLLAVDHPPGTTVVMDPEGTPHAFARTAPLSAARDERDANLLPWLRDRDEVVWYPDLKTFSRSDSIEDTRNHIVLEFPRPHGLRQAHLVAHAATGLWGAHMLRQMLRLRGTSLGDFYGAVNSSPLVRRQLHDWNAREEVFVLFLEVETSRGWERQGFLFGGGPLVSESRAIPLDLSAVEGPTVRVRLHPPIGFWALNSFHLAWEERPVSSRELAPVSARQPSGRDVLPALLREDDVTMDFPEYGDRAEVVFEAPERASGTERTVFARTRGWYEIHLRGLGPPDAASIARLTAEPGYAVRMGLTEFRAYQETGAWAGSP